MGQETNVEAIVLQAYPFRESSRMVDLISHTGQRFSLVAKGARRNKSPFLNLTVPYVRAFFDWAEGRQNNFLNSGEILDAHLGLRKSLGRLSLARLATDLIMAVLVGEEEALFSLLSSFLDVVEDAPEAMLSHLLAAYTLKLSAFSGFRPSLGRCAICARPILRGQVPSWSVESGGVLCPDHATQLGARPLGEATYRSLLAYLQKPLRAIIDPNVLAAESGPKLARLCLDYFSYHTGIRSFPSLAMVKRLGLLS